MKCLNESREETSNSPRIIQNPFVPPPSHNDKYPSLLISLFNIMSSYTTSDMIPTNKKELMSNAMKRTTEWIFSQQISSDVSIIVQGVSFSLHKFPLVSKCGYMRKMMSSSKEADCVIEINDIPGGPAGFELAAKFCYGINFEITIENVATARCVAEYLEMTDDYVVGNLITRTEAYLTQVGLNSLAGAICILQSAESLVPVADDVKLITRGVDAIAFIVTKESQFAISANADCNIAGLGSHSSSSSSLVDWWAEDLIVLRIYTFQRVLLAMISRGFNKFALGPIVTLYAQKCLKDLDILGKGKTKNKPNKETEKRVVLETIVSLLPREKNAISVSFISMLLRSAIYLETTVACRLDLEKRMGLQLPEASLNDILIPSFRFDGDTLFDVDTVQRILMNYGELKLTRDDMEKVGKLMESYLVEIASDCNLSLPKFINLVEHIPNQDRVSDDGMYKIVDIYLKAHSGLNDTEINKLCSLINCQKLTIEACADAAQNDRLSPQMVARVVYYQQKRLKEEMDPLPGDLSSLQKENQELKFELLKAKMKLKDIKNSNLDMSSQCKRSFMSSVSKKFVKFTPFLWADHGVLPSIIRNKNKPRKERRHSIS